MNCRGLLDKAVVGKVTQKLTVKEELVLLIVYVEPIKRSATSIESASEREKERIHKPAQKLS